MKRRSGHGRDDSAQAESLDIDAARSEDISGARTFIAERARSPASISTRGNDDDFHIRLCLEGGAISSFFQEI